ncbi:MAG TPA: hypothetical protein VHW06_14285 [Streptosporangiaceae bacterium]|jgi:hypothetical protein|nr:hypothetical protein [Streptosporangiaceae bacterium]
MARIIILLLSALNQRRMARYEAALAGAQSSGWGGSAAPRRAAGASYRLNGVTDPAAADPRVASRADGQDVTRRDGWTEVRPPPQFPPPRPRRRWIPRWVKWSVFLVLAGLVFRRAVAALVMTALSATLHLVGLNLHLPDVKFAWPWQTAGAAPATSNVDLGPWVLQKIEGISKPALGTENFNFVFTHKVSKDIGPWPCWYSSTFYAVGHASATVNLNPGPSWWGRATGHYQLQVLSRPSAGQTGRVSIVMTLPSPQLPQTVHDVTIDNTLSKPLSTSHSWTYPGLGCGTLIRPQFSPSAVYAAAQQQAFYRVNHVSSVTRPLISAAESQAAQIIRNGFVQPTVNALGYTLDSFTLRWAS